MANLSRLTVLPAAIAIAILSTSVSLAQPVIGAAMTGTTLDSNRVLVSLVDADGVALTRADLNSGSVDLTTTIDDSGNFLGTYDGFGLPGLTSFDMDQYLSKEDTTGDETFPSNPGNPANPIDVINFGADIGVISGNWTGTNGAADDFFLYEVSSSSVGAGEGAFIDAQAILPGGTIGDTVFLELVGDWFDVGEVVTGGPNSGQPIRGYSFSVQELFDENGSALPADAELEGLRILTTNADFALVAATKTAEPLEMNVNTTTGEVTITNPNTSHTLGTNFYRITSPTSALDNEGWDSLDDQEGNDGAGVGWVEGGGSDGPALAGDFNEDGSVDAADYTVWRDGLDDEFTQDDYDDWADNFGATATGSATDQLLELRNDGLLELAPGQSVSLGLAFDTSGEENLTFNYGTREGLLVEGVVNYSAGSGVAVPEPASGLLLALGGVLAGLFRRRPSSGFAQQAIASSSCEGSSALMKVGSRAAFLVLFAWSAVTQAQLVSSPTLIYDGSQDIVTEVGEPGFEVAVGSALTGDEAISLITATGEGAWFAGGSNAGSNQTALGASGSAAGVDGAYMTNAAMPGNGGGGGGVYVYRDDRQTTGIRTLDLSLFYDDLTPNTPGSGISPEAESGGNVHIRITGVYNNGTPDTNPWDSEFTISASGGRSGANIASAQYNRNGSADSSTFTQLLNIGSNNGAIANTDGWDDLTFEFDAGTGFDWLVFGFSGQSNNLPDPITNPSDRFGFDNILIDVGETAVPTVIIDRDTGDVSFQNDTTLDYAVKGYTFTSDSGSLDTDGWASIAENLDADNGGGFDSASNWTVSSATSSELSESADSGDGGDLAPNGGANFSLGSPWARSPFTDAEVIFTLETGETVAGAINYTGSGPLNGDLNDDGSIDEDDFALLAANSYTDLSGMTPLEQYYAGDLNGDGANNFNDFQNFRGLFDAANGAGSFQQLVAGVPEPAAGMMAIMAIGLTTSRRVGRATK